MDGDEGIHNMAPLTRFIQFNLLQKLEMFAADPDPHFALFLDC